MLVIAKGNMRIPTLLIDDYSHEIWSSVHNGSTQIHPNVVNPKTLQMCSQPYILSEEGFHNEVLS